MSLDQTGEKSELYRYVYAQRVEMFSNIFVFIIAEVWSQGCVILFVLTGECFVYERKQNFAFCKNSSFICLFVFSLNKDIFFRSRFEYSKNVLNTNFNIRSREIHGNFAWSTFHQNSGLLFLHLNFFPCKNRFFRE